LPAPAKGLLQAMTQSSSTASAPPANLASLVASCLGEPEPRLEPLPGGLSPRQFFRLVRASGERAIVMWLPESAPERLLASRLGRQLPFLEMRTLLENARVRVPKLYGALPEQGLLIVEDLGETLAERLERAPGERDALYRRAVVDLAAAQRALAELPRDCIVQTRAFDRELLTWEVEHFREWGIEALGVTLSDDELSTFSRATAHLVDTILGFERGFVHRDYQSRNLMVLPDGSIGWIDFQDALLGPRAYDLVALLCDSYQSLEQPFVAKCLDEFAGEAGLSVEQRGALGFELDVITVQRKLKDAGRFVFFERTRGDASYLRYFVPALQLVLGALSRLPERPELEALTALVERQVEIGRGRGMLSP
jgi:aminoglycoside/choline kinase family phosphotransferase